jgi:hypothetical protein
MRIQTQSAGQPHRTDTAADEYTILERGITAPAVGRTQASPAAPRAVAADDDQERSGRLLLLGKGAVLADRLARPLAAESDDEEEPARHGKCGRGGTSQSVELDSERGAAPFASTR